MFFPAEEGAEPIPYDGGRTLGVSGGWGSRRLAGEHRSGRFALVAAAGGGQPLQALPLQQPRACSAPCRALARSLIVLFVCSRFPRPRRR